MSGAAAGIRPVQPLADYERRFRRAGLPLFIEGFSAREDVWTRASPFLALVFIGEVLGAIQLDWSFLANVAAATGGLAISVIAFGLVNLSRKRPFWSLPRDIGVVELAAFVVIPAGLPLIFGGQVGSALVTLAANAVLLLVTYSVVAYGLFAIVRWTVPRLLEQMVSSVGALSRSVPLLMVFALVLFLNTEMWQVFSEMPDAYLVLVGLMVVLVGVTFVTVRLPREVRVLEDEAGAGAPPLDGRQRVNVALVLFASQGLQVAVVALAVASVFVVFGALAVGPDVRKIWEVTDGGTVVSFTLLGDRIVITEALLRVAGAIGALSGVYYAIAVLTDATYRKEFLDELTREMRETFTARAEYLELRARD
jgi:hypothetical protein